MSCIVILELLWRIKMTNKCYTNDGICVNFLNGECDHMNGCYVKWLDDNYDYIKNFDTLYYRLLSKAKVETKMKCKLFTIFETRIFKE